jgi:hypothetical protein
MSILATYATGLGTAIGLALAWVAVQHAWRRTFPERLRDADALAGRIGCFGCLREDECERRGACRAEER